MKGELPMTTLKKCTVIATIAFVLTLILSCSSMHTLKLIYVGPDEPTQASAKESAAQLPTDPSAAQQSAVLERKPAQVEDVFARYCKSGHQIEQMVAMGTGAYNKPMSGTPLDKAVNARREQLENMRSNMHNYFYAKAFCEPSDINFCTARDPELLQLVDEYTMFIPPSIQHKLGSAGYQFSWAYEQQSSVPSPSRAIEHRDKLWRNYFLQFTTVKEAQSSDPNEVHFESSLDLNLFCKYGRPIDDLVTK